MLSNVLAICATSGRHTCLERSLRFFLDQDYDGEHTLLIFNNSEVSQELHLPDVISKNKRIILINSDLNSSTGEKYASLGEIYIDALRSIDLSNIDLIIFWDDDDIFLPNHISEGVKGYLRAKEISDKNVAYKPAYSYYRNDIGISLVSNTLEPSIFVEKSHILEYGFSQTTSDQHLQWVKPLKDKIFLDENGTPTLVYNWGDVNIPTFKTSGDPGNIRNFFNYRNFSQDHGDGVITPVDIVVSEEYYEQAGFFKST